jgi:hypothetical protein
MSFILEQKEYKKYIDNVCFINFNTRLLGHFNLWLWCLLLSYLLIIIIIIVHGFEPQSFHLFIIRVKFLVIKLKNKKNYHFFYAIYNLIKVVSF